jgi:membrane protease YdiL (CAAX protease family)
MKKNLISILLFFYLGLSVFAVFLLPNLNSLFPVDVITHALQYALVIITYLCMTVLMLQEPKTLHEFNLESISISLLVIFSVIRINLHIPYEYIPRAIILILSIVIVLITIRQYKIIPRIKFNWIALGFVTCILVIPLGYFASLLYTYSSALEDQYSLLNVIVQGLIFNMSFFALPEEIMFRGIFWGILRNWGWGDKRIALFQALIFWALHYQQLLTYPLFFFVIIPVEVLILTILVYTSKKIFPAILFHAVANTFIILLANYFAQ